MPGLIAFDLDGTLVDSRRDLAGAANRLIVELGGSPLDERTLGAMIGEGVRAFVERALAAGCGLAGASALHVARFAELYSTGLLEHTLPYPGVRHVLERLSRRTLLGVLTNKPQAPAEAILRGLALDRYFDAVIGDGVGFPRKPEPAGLESLIALAGTGPEDCLLVGDSLVDRETADRAGTAVALARYGYGYTTFPTRRLLGDEVLLDTPHDLLAYLGLPRI